MSTRNVKQEQGSSSQPGHSFKILVIGSFAIGKLPISKLNTLQRLAHEDSLRDDPAPLPEHVVDVFHTSLRAEDATVSIRWDTDEIPPSLLPAERYALRLRALLKGRDACMLLYDVNYRESFDWLRWVVETVPDALPTAVFVVPRQTNRFSESLWDVSRAECVAFADGFGAVVLHEWNYSLNKAFAMARRLLLQRARKFSDRAAWKREITALDDPNTKIQRDITDEEHETITQYLSRNRRAKLKVLVLGVRKVGKKALVHTLDNAHGGPDWFDPTLFDDPRTTVFGYNDALTIEWQDVHAEETLDPGYAITHEMIKNMARESDACLLVYSVADRRSLESLEWTHGLIRTECDKVYVVGSKIDLEKKLWEVQPVEARRFAAKIGAEFRLLSAKTGEGMGPAETAIIAYRLLLARIKAESPPAQSGKAGAGSTAGTSGQGRGSRGSRRNVLGYLRDSISKRLSWKSGKS